MLHQAILGYHDSSECDKPNWTGSNELTKGVSALCHMMVFVLSGQGRHEPCVFVLQSWGFNTYGPQQVVQGVPLKREVDVEKSKLSHSWIVSVSVSFVCTSSTPLMTLQKDLFERLTDRVRWRTHRHGGGKAMERGIWRGWNQEQGVLKGMCVVCGLVVGAWGPEKHFGAFYEFITKSPKLIWNNIIH